MKTSGRGRAAQPVIFASPGGRPRPGATTGEGVINWRLKWLGFELFSLPGLGRRLYYLFQRYVTRSIPRPDMDHALELSLGHFQRLERFSPVPLEQARHFEFGAGWDLFNNLCLYGLGLNQQVSIDISCLARHDLINAVIAYLQDHRPAEMTRLPDRPLPPDFADPLRELYGIDYRPFCDAGATGLSRPAWRSSPPPTPWSISRPTPCRPSWPNVTASWRPAE